MNIPDAYYRYLIQAKRGNFQINTDYDANGDEIYSGVAEARALTSDPIWAIGKAVYTNNGTVNLMTHWSFLTGITWDDRKSQVFP
jgi:hypothetical protein